MMQTKMLNKKWIQKILDLVIDTPKQKSDLLNILRESLTDGLIDNDSLTMIEGVFKVSEMQVREIMIPRPHMIVLDISDDVRMLGKKIGKVSKTEIDDEHDKAGELRILTQNRNTFIVDALTSLQEFNNHFSTDFEDEDVETIGGYLINQFEKVPQKGENIKINNLLFKVLSADSRKINRIQVTKSITKHK